VQIIQVVERERPKDEPLGHDRRCDGERGHVEYQSLLDVDHDAAL
jgi:hypothetical protein